jgi:hypothetical protein
MATCMGVEERLEGSGSFGSWKHRLEMILDENMSHGVYQNQRKKSKRPSVRKKGRESINHMWQRKKNLLPQRKI